MNPKSLPYILFLSVFLISGCYHAPAPFLPHDAKNIRILPEQLQDGTSACLQVLVIYAPYVCAHTALRLYSPENGSLFWDPAGSYGIDGSVPAKRENDLVFDRIPTLNDYIFFRTEIITSALEIFEWEISEKRADELRTTLLQGTGLSHPKGLFLTNGTGLFCGISVSDFLNRFADDIVSVEKTFYPHNLAKQLYTQSPDRIILVDLTHGVDIRHVFPDKTWEIEETKTAGNVDGT